MTIWNTMMGTSLLAVPWAIQQSGLATGLALVFFMTIISYSTAFIIIDLYGKHNSKYFDDFYLEKPLVQGVPSQNVFFKRAKNVRKPICR